MDTRRFIKVVFVDNVLSLILWVRKRCGRFVKIILIVGGSLHRQGIQRLTRSEDEQLKSPTGEKRLTHHVGSDKISNLFNYSASAKFLPLTWFNLGGTGHCKCRAAAWHSGVLHLSCGWQPLHDAVYQYIALSLASRRFHRVDATPIAFYTDHIATAYHCTLNHGAVFQRQAAVKNHTMAVRAGGSGCLRLNMT